MGKQIIVLSERDSEPFVHGDHVFVIVPEGEVEFVRSRLMRAEELLKPLPPGLVDMPEGKQPIKG